MNSHNLAGLLKNLQDAEDQILILQLFDEENYDYFAKKIETLRQTLSGFDDKKSTYELAPIIQEITALESEITEYMEKGKIIDDSNDPLS